MADEKRATPMVLNVDTLPIFAFKPNSIPIEAYKEEKPLDSHRIVLFVCRAMIVVCVYVSLETIYNRYGHLLVRHTGFQCDDPSIQKPYIRSDLTMRLLLQIALFVPLIVIMLTEMWRVRFAEWERWNGQIGKAALRWALRVVSHYYIFFLSLTLNLLVLFAAKFSVGRLRPHFLNVCRPDVQCFGDDYVEDFECLNNVSPKVLANTRMSFFSGHSSVSAGMAAFICIYLHCRIAAQKKSLCLVLIPLYLGFVGFAGFCAYGRVVENHHHLSDVVTGLVVGATVAAATALISGLRPAKTVNEI